MISLKWKSLTRGANSQGLASHFTRILRVDVLLRTMLTFKMLSDNWPTVKNLTRVHFVSYRRIIDFGQNICPRLAFFV